MGRHRAEDPAIPIPPAYTPTWTRDWLSPTEAKADKEQPDITKK